MSQKIFKEASEVLWGPQYRSEAARQLGVHLRTVMRWDAGERRVPQVTLALLAKLLVQRRAEIDKLHPKILAEAGKGL